MSALYSRRATAFAAIAAVVWVMGPGPAVEAMERSSRSAEAALKQVEWLDQGPQASSARLLNGQSVQARSLQEGLDQARNVDVEEVKALLGKLLPQAKRLRLDAHVTRLQQLIAVIRLQDRTERSAALQALGVTSSKAGTQGNSVTTFSVKAQARLRIYEAWSVSSFRERLAEKQRPDGSDAVRFIDSLDDAAQTRDDDIAYALAVAEESEAAATDIENTDWSGTCPGPVGGPSDDDSLAGCWAEAAAAVGNFLTSSYVARGAVNAIQSAWNTLTAAADAAYAQFTGGEIGAAALDTAIEAAVDIFMGACSWEVIGIAGAVVLAAVAVTLLVECAAPSTESYLIGLNTVAIPRMSLLWGLSAKGK